MSELETSHDENSSGADNLVIVSWEDRFSVGIDLIDNQHKKLIVLTNQLYNACRQGAEQREAAFKEAMGQMVEYVRIHFGTEQKIFEKIKYPQAAEHTREHDSFVKKVLEESKKFGEGSKTTTAVEFVMYLKNWIVTHIAHSDTLYAHYIMNQRRKQYVDNLSHH